ATAWAYRCGGGCISGSPGLARLPPLQNTAVAAQLAALFWAVFSLQARASWRFSSDGVMAHCSAAFNAACCGAGASLGRDFFTARQAHQIASRLGRPWAGDCAAAESTDGCPTRWMNTRGA